MQLIQESRKDFVSLEKIFDEATLCDQETKYAAERLRQENLTRLAGRRELKAEIRATIDKRRGE